MGEDLIVRFCPNCGRSESEVKLLTNNFCPDCYRALHPLLITPNYLSLTICPRCESIRVKKRWLGPIGLGDAVSTALRQTHALQTGATAEVDEVELPAYAPELRVNVIARGRSSEELSEYPEPHNLLLRLHWETCTDCLESRRKNRPYKIQLRSDVGRLSHHDLHVSDTALNEALYLHPSRFERKEVPGGLDLEFENSSTVGEILAILRRKRLGVEHVSTEGVMRLPSGAQVSKRTHVFRFLSLEPGEVVHLEEGDVRVEGVMRGRAVITELKTNKRSTLPIERLFDAKSAVI